MSALPVIADPIGPSTAHLLDPRFGPLLSLRRQRLGGTEPRWWLTTGHLTRHPLGSLFTPAPGTSAGTSLDPGEATARAAGEAVERYCALTATVPSVSASLREVGLLDRIPVCAPDEASPPTLRRPDPDAPLQQVPTERVTGGPGQLFPAGFVCLGYRPPAGEPLVTLPISTGLAFHPSQTQALWRGLCEVLERDAVLSAWWIHRPTPAIDTRGAPHRVQERISRLTAAGLTPYLFDITTELEVPTVFCVLTGPEYPFLVVGAATRSSAADAAAKALDEVVSMRVAMRLHGNTTGAGIPDPRTAEAPASPRTLVDHALLYARGGPAGALDFLLRSGLSATPWADFADRSIPEPEDRDTLIGAVAQLENTGITVWWTDLTTPDMAGRGSVVRVVVPELVPLSPDDSIRWLGTRRLLARAAVTTASRRHFTPHPHPFA